MPASPLQRLSDEVLLARTTALVHTQRQTTAELLAHLAEIEQRSLHLARGCGSLFAYCTERLGMSEDEAYMRIRVARAARRFPRVAEALANGHVHLSGLCRLAAHLTEQNHRELLLAAQGRTKREIDQMLAERFPRPDAPDSLRKLPAPRRRAAVKKDDGEAAAGRGASAQAAINQPARSEDETPRQGDLLASHRGPRLPDRAAPAEDRDQAHDAVAHDAVAHDAVAHDAVAVRPTKDRPRVEPTAADRYRVQFTASRALHDKIRAAQDLLRHELPDGDLSAVCERAFDVLLGTLRQRKFALLPKSERARRRKRSDKRTRHIPVDVKRAVRERDGERCAFVDEKGRRCSATGMLEFHHVDPYGRGGPHTAANVQIVCSAHNRYLAQQAYGAARIAQRIADEPRHQPSPEPRRQMDQARLSQTHSLRPAGL
jgi:hypothetical protein